MQFIKKLFSSATLTETQKIHREWDRQRQSALGPSDLAEIDAIFSRALHDVH